MTYDQGQRRGYEVHYHDTGATRMVVPVKAGQRQGTANVYTRGGRLWADIPYRNHAKHGVEKRFSPDGKAILEEHVFDQGKLVEVHSYVQRIRRIQPPKAPKKAGK